MKPALLLIDMQGDHLAAAGLEPPAGELVENAARLLHRCREAAVPVIHVWTTVSAQSDDRMPHWRRSGRWACVAGTDGHEPPPPLAPEGEAVVERTEFSAFASPDLDPRLAELGVEDLILCGVHLHGCVRATALDAYQRRYRVWVAADAVGSYDGLHGAVSRQYLDGRAARFETVAALLDRLRRDDGGDPAAPVEPGRAAAAAATAGKGWRTMPGEDRAALLDRAAAAIDASSAELAELIVGEIGKPLRYARAEVERTAALLHAAAALPEPAQEPAGEAAVRRLPVGTVAQITPFNNPLAIAAGKLAPALRYGNSVVWKPSPAAPAIARRTVELLAEAGLPDGLVPLLEGDAAAGAALIADRAVDAVSITGSSAAGFAAQSIAARRRIPVQAELGGNNAAIVWGDCDVPAAAAAIAAAAFGAAGQRCTANRRAIVEAGCHEEFVRHLEAEAAALAAGDPADPAVHVGPLVSETARERVAAAIDRTRDAHEVREAGPARSPMPAHLAGRYLPATIVLCEDPAAEIVQEETFGPVLVVQRASSFEEALELLNGVRQGLVASLFSTSAARREAFLAAAEAGVLKIGRATADVGVEAPFGGWKASGVGPPEHGSANLDFYTRAQSVYG